MNVENRRTNLGQAIILSRENRYRQQPAIPSKESAAAIMIDERTLKNRVLGCDDSTSFARTYRFKIVEAKCSRVSESPQPSAFIRAAGGLTCVLNDHQIMLACNCKNGVHVAGVTTHMYRDNGSSFLSNAGSQIVNIDCQCMIDICYYWHSSRRNNSDYGRNKSIRRNDRRISTPADCSRLYVQAPSRDASCTEPRAGQRVPEPSGAHCGGAREGGRGAELLENRCAGRGDGPIAVYAFGWMLAELGLLDHRK